MSTKYDLRLIGNLIVDKIYCVNNFDKQGTSNELVSQYESVGGIGNMVGVVKDKLKIFVEGVIGSDENGKKVELYLKYTDSFLDIYKGETSCAVIISNLKNSERTSFVSWGNGKSEFEPTKHHAKWTHVCYLDTTNIDLAELRETSEILSADLCLSNPDEETMSRVISQCKYLDYLFVSEKEFNPYLNGSKFSVQNLVLHEKDRTYVFDKKDSYQVFNDSEILKNVNVLGCGDVYCANFILYQLTNELDNKAAAKFAHDQTYKFLTDGKKI